MPFKLLNRVRPRLYRPLSKDVARTSTIDNVQFQLVEAGKWKPTWIRRTVVAGFVICFAVLLAALETLSQISFRRRGLVSANADRYYIWKYGPTALLTVVLALWGRADYRVRQMSAWKSRSIGTHSLFLDYISPTLPEILWKSLRIGDYDVAASGLVVLFLNLIIVASTGLLTLELQPSYSFNTTYRSTSKFDNATEEDLYGGVTEWGTPSSLQSLDTSSLPLVTLDAIDTMGLAYPIGTTEDMNYQTFEALDAGLTGAIQTANVDIVVYEPSCIATEVSVSGWNFSWPDCSTYNPTPERAITSGYGLFLHGPDCALSPYIDYDYGEDGQISNFAFFDTTYCRGTNVSEYTSLIFGIGQAKQVNSTGLPPESERCANGVYDYAGDVQLLRSRQWVCQPHFYIVPGNVTFNSSQATAHQTPQIQFDPSVQRQSLMKGHWLTASLSRLRNSPDTPTIETPPFLSDLNLSKPAEFIQMFRHVPKNAKQEDLFSTDLFLDLALAYYKRISVQQTRIALTQRSTDLVQGTAIQNQSRLVVRTIPLRFMEAFLAACVLLATYLCIKERRLGFLQSDPSRLAGILQIVARIPVLRTCFLDTSLFKQRALRQAFLSRNSNSGQHQDLGSASVGWWRPLVVITYSRSCMILLLLLLIVALEILLSKSNQFDGLATVSTTDNEHLAWSLSSAAIMVLIAIYFRALCSNYKLFSPYQQLRQSATFRPLLTNYLSPTEVESFAQSIRDKQFGITFISLVAILSSFLSIIVAGVWTPELISDISEVALASTSWFDISSSDNGTVGNNAFVAEVVLALNASYPQWTYENLAFGSYDINSSVSVESPQKQIKATLPAIRASLDCTVYDQDQIPDLAFKALANGSTNTGDFSSYQHVQLRLPGPQGCAGNTTVNIGVKSPEHNIVIGFTKYFQNTIPGCPPLVYVWGRQDATYITNNETLFNVSYAKALACYEIVEKVEVDTTFTSDLNIDTTNPPQVRGNPQTFSTANITLPYVSLPALENNETSIASGFWGAINYQYGVLLADYGNPAKTDTIVNTIKSAHGIIRAQQYNAALRSSDPSLRGDDVPGVVTAQLIDPTRYRLVQNAISTHVLCALLAAIAVFTVISSYFISTKQVLPKNPCSVAAQISFLADSNILDNKQVMAELEHGLRGKKPNLADKRFKMGWFMRPYGGGKVFTVNMVDSDGDRELEKLDGSPLLSLGSPSVEEGRTDSGSAEKHSARIKRKPLPSSAYTTTEYVGLRDV